MNPKRFGTAAFTALLKTILMIFNIVFTAFGIVFLAVGIYGMRAFKDVFSFAPGQAIYLPIICIGIFMSIVGVLSLWCTPKGVTWLLYLYSGVIFILFLTIFTISTIFLVRRDSFEHTIKDGMNKTINNYPANKETIDLLQKHIHCCGLNDFRDWFGTAWANGNKTVPLSCCKVDEKKCNHENISQNSADIYQKGCYKILEDAIEENYLLIGGIGFASAVIILFGSLLTCCLSSNLKKNRYEEVE